MDSILSPMQVILQPIDVSEGGSIVVETNSQATVASLISTFCTQRGVAFDSSLVILDGKERPLPQFSTLASLGITNGQTLLIGVTDNKFSFATQWPILVAFLALLIGVAGILAISLVYGLTGGLYPDDYGVVMDAGSSKTNTIVYKWRSDKYHGTGYVYQENFCKAKGGIAEMDPMELGPVINCAKKVTEIINESARPKTPLFFAATAGMRLLNSTNPERADQILEQLNLHLNETGLSVRRIEIITGSDEGIYGWITANFLQQTLEIPQKLDPWVPTTFGALDMGGASMQIAYAVSEEDVKSLPEETTNLTLYGQKHNIFSHSNLCFGRDEAQRRYRFFLMKDPNVTDIFDPCLPLGFNLTVKGEYFRRPCTNSTKFPDIYAKSYTFKGTSSLNFCAGNVSKLLKEDICEDYGFQECFKNLEDIPINQEYLAFATYYFTTNFLNVTNSSLDEYKEAMNAFCLKTGSEIDNEYNISANGYVTEYCFNANYILEVLLNGFGFNNNTWNNIQFVNQIAGKDVGWTLGYMVNATNFIPEKAKTPKIISAAALAVSLILFIIVIIGTLIFILQYQRKDSGNRSAVVKA